MEVYHLGKEENKFIDCFELCIYGVGLELDESKFVIWLKNNFDNNIDYIIVIKSNWCEIGKNFEYSLLIKFKKGYSIENGNDVVIKNKLSVLSYYEKYSKSVFVSFGLSLKNILFDLLESIDYSSERHDIFLYNVCVEELALILRKTGFMGFSLLRKKSNCEEILIYIKCILKRWKENLNIN